MPYRDTMTPKKIFIVDDNPHLLKFLEKALIAEGYEIETANTGLSAVEKLADYNADVIFIDYFLPQINADRICQIIRKMEHLKSAHLIVMSAAASELELDPKKIQVDAIIAKGNFKETAARLASTIKNTEKPVRSDSKGEVIGLESIYPRRMTKELLAQNIHLRAMLDSISEGIVEIFRGQVVYANPASEKLLDIPQVKMLTAYFPDLFSDQQRAQVESLVQFGKKGSGYGEQKEIIRIGKKILWMKTFPLENDEDTVIVLITDVTDRVRAEEALKDYQQHLESLVEKRTYDLKCANEKLRRAQKMEAIGTVAGGVAHDLNNILSGIVSYPDLLMLELPEESPLIKPVRAIQKSGEKAAAIVQDLLTLARRGALKDEILSLNHIISEYLRSPEFSKMKSYHMDVDVKYVLEEELLNIIGSSFHLSKALMNLVSNAAEAIQDEGTIWIRTENCYVDRDLKGHEVIPMGEYVTLEVSDDGIGISDSDMGRIFEPFYTKKKMGRSGTGLGMAVVWGTVKDHNGYIDIQSELGKGTTFKLYLPATREALTKKESPIMMKDYMGKKESILVVDDEEEQREIASSILNKLGYLVYTVPSGEEAVDYLTRNSVDLIVLDMIMDPGMDGLETYKKIHEFSPGQKAIIASGFSETEWIKEARRLGTGAYIKKPYTMERIGMAVRRELDRRS